MFVIVAVAVAVAVAGNSIIVRTLLTKTSEIKNSNNFEYQQRINLLAIVGNENSVWLQFNVDYIVGTRTQAQAHA